MTFYPNHRVLLIDDNAAIHEDIRKILTGPKRNPSLAAAESVLFDAPPATASLLAKFEIDSAYQGQQGLEKVLEAVGTGRPYAMAFVDVRMPPGWDGIETIEHLWRVDTQLQIVLCTAHSDYSWERMTARLGMNENLVILKKPFDNIEVLQLAHALTKKWEMTRQANLRLETLDQMVQERTADLQRVNMELSRSEERFSKAFRSSPFPFVIQSVRDDCFVDVNDAFERMTGFSRSELAGHPSSQLRLDYARPLQRDSIQQKAFSNLEAKISTKSGEWRQLLVAHEPIALAGEAHVLVMMQDITERLRIETELRQAQKMEAIGQLAAGVAHDFNNLLTIIEGHASLQLCETVGGPTPMESFEQIARAADRATDLTRKLLTFSRRQILCPQMIDLNTLVRDLTSLLSRLINKGIELREELDERLPSIYADRTSIEQIIMNLALNARDAMPRGGTILIQTSETRFAEENIPPASDARPGEFICLQVTDTGTGMDEATRRHIFEPFFTTKEVDKGTGMGLATVYGIVKQHRGWIEVVSAPGEGATFRVFLPLSNERLESLKETVPVRPPQPLSQRHTLLIVEDDDAVRGVVREILNIDGYMVLEAPNADDAMRLWEDDSEHIDLMLTDMIMPGSASGIELARRLQGEKPDLKVIYTSGYSVDLFNRHLELTEGVNYLPKPYLSSKLLTILRNAFEPAE
ncbi:MAG: response regulator [Verrucomicrobiota bacterium]